MDADEIFKKLKPVLAQKLDPLWLEYQLNPKKRSEIEGFLHLLAAKHLGKPYSERQIFLAPPPPEQSLGDFPLGIVLYGDKEIGTFGLRHKEWIQHVGMFGRTGSGKTNVGFLIALALLEKNIPILVFDWKRNYRDLLQIADPNKLTVYTVGRSVSPFAFNPLIPPPGTKPSIWLKKLIEIMCHVYWLGEGVAFLLQNAIDVIYEQFGVYAGDARARPTLADVKEWLNKAKVRGREGQWMDSAKRAIGTLCYGDIGTVLNARRPSDLGTLLRSNAILELDALTNTDKTFLIEALVLWIHHQRLQEKDRETLKHAMIIEEAHHALLKRKQSKETIMDVILREIRELGEAIILIDQHPSLISVPSLGNTHTTIAMNLKHGQDVATLASAMLLDGEEKEYLGRLPVGHAIVRLQSRWYEPFLVRFPLLKIEKGKIRDRELAGKAVKPPVGSSGENSEVLVGEEVKQEILPIRGAEKVTTEEIELLKDVMGNITSGVVERYSRLGFSAYLGNKIQSSLVWKELIEPVSIRTSKGRVRVLWLTEKGREAMKTLGFAAPARGRGGVEHEYWKERVAQHLLKLGYQIEVEKPIGGGKTIDLVASNAWQEMAIEIETGGSDLEQNAEKCIAAGFHTVLLVFTSKVALHQARRTLGSGDARLANGVELLDLDDVLGGRFLQRDGRAKPVPAQST